jgi:hypothetical protein
MTPDGSVVYEIKHRMQSGWRNFKNNLEESYAIKATVQG